MSFTEAVRTCLAKYFTFSGRASRPEYWWFMLFIFGMSLILGVLDGMIFGFNRVEYAPDAVQYEANGPLSSLFSLATLIPILSAGWRRMHDSGRTGLHLFYPLIVIIGVTTFMGVVAGFGPVLQGDFGAVIAGGSTLILVFAMVVFLISPLVVLWWLTRPSQPHPNKYGPPPAHIAARNE
ncbi:Uncharacterized membrane protein YhaH, DUF805 family [Palleronia salina]|uniref:Uncharacterized membrane protein YhaH, DUF805 family n=1 Tax=Palleronia salina TaxID=313368 RepID=A0A1M6FTC0_9RHOB|nr:DUF805 domain-containing protein [Palleronia salina]SHJ00941.1 Uncharacterized membrane protein YhaH, DUF805 family [Palleronia salina]